MNNPLKNSFLLQYFLNFIITFLKLKSFISNSSILSNWSTLTYCWRSSSVSREEVRFINMFNATEALSSCKLWINFDNRTTCNTWRNKGEVSWSLTILEITFRLNFWNHTCSCKLVISFIFETDAHKSVVHWTKIMMIGIIGNVNICPVCNFCPIFVPKLIE